MNRTLGEQVIFSGVYQIGSDADQLSNAVSARAIAVQQQRLQSRAAGRALIQGQATINGRDRVEVNAVLK